MAYNTLIFSPITTHGARIVPSMKMGKPDGIRIYAIRPGTALAALGFQNGDQIGSINGIALINLEQSLAVPSKLKTVHEIQVALARHGQPVTLTYKTM